MTLPVRLVLCLALAGLCGGGKMWLDIRNERAWYVSPRQIEEAKLAGKQGVSTRPGTVAVRPIRAEDADVLPYTWALYGLGGAMMGFAFTRRRKQA